MPAKSQKVRPMTSSRMSSRRWPTSRPPVALSAAPSHRTIVAMHTSSPRSFTWEMRYTWSLDRTWSSPGVTLSMLIWFFWNQQSSAITSSSDEMPRGTIHITSAIFQETRLSLTRQWNSGSQSVHLLSTGSLYRIQMHQMTKHQREADSKAFRTSSSQSWGFSSGSQHIAMYNNAALCRVSTAGTTHGNAGKQSTALPPASSVMRSQASGLLP
mmetsp:Transcript_139016/g.387749  ORF Transcript_139016/g.387749 Transcript_139016/m.387749 type:complete len:213 (-) Transcript_139016:250-888(-)